MGVARVSVAVCALAVWLGVLAPGAQSAPDVRFGIQDDAWLEHGPGTIADRVREIRRLGLDIVRITLRWDEMEPSPGAYDWRRSDRMLNALRAGGVDALVTIWGTPHWAATDGVPYSAPRRAVDIYRFARAAASRYPFVLDWTMWNEPNRAAWLKPVSAETYVKRILNPGVQGIKAANTRARVAGGVTSPQGGDEGMNPVDFIRAMARAGARLDAYAHHPYPTYPGDTPFPGGCESCQAISMSTLERLIREVDKAFPQTPIWLTEYGYQTKPDLVGVAFAEQARFVAEAARRVYEAPRVEMLIQYLYRDEPDLEGWQSGLETVDGTPKPALAATMLPLTQVSRTVAETTVWGQVRPGTGRRKYVLEIRRGRRWVALSGVQLTSPGGYFRRTVHAGEGSLLRVRYPARALVSPTLVVE
jgi:hypothetical protein